MYSLRPVPDFRITLEARNPARHGSRQYRVAALRSVHGEEAVEGLSIYSG